MDRLYIEIAAVVTVFVVGVVFSPGIARLFARLFTDVKAEYEKALTEVKAIYDADTKALMDEVTKVHADWDADVAKLKAAWFAEVARLKSDLGEANVKVAGLTAVIKGATVLAPAIAQATTTTRTKAQIAADLATTQATEAQLQSDLAAATA